MELSNRAIQWVSNWPTVKQITSDYLKIYQSQQLSSKKDKALTPIYNTNKLAVNNNFGLNKNSRLSECLSSKLEQLPAFPEINKLVLPSKANIVVAVPHPDDETIWCGATLSKLSANQCNISAILFTDGELGDPHKLFPNESIGEKRYNEFKDASKYNGINNVLRLQQPDGNYRVSEQLKLKILTWLEQQQADWVFIPHLLDAHRDHILVSLTMLELYFQTNGFELIGRENQIPPRLFFYDGWWPTQVNSFVDISDNIDIKEQAIKVYTTPLTCVDYVSLSKHLNRYRGLSLGGCEHAEVFFEVTKNNYSDILKSMSNLRLKLN